MTRIIRKDSTGLKNALTVSLGEETSLMSIKYMSQNNMIVRLQA